MMIMGSWGSVTGRRTVAARSARGIWRGFCLGVRRLGPMKQKAAWGRSGDGGLSEGFARRAFGAAWRRSSGRGRVGWAWI